MRLLDNFQDGPTAHSLLDFLREHGITAKLDHDSEENPTNWTIWILDEDQVSTAQRLLSEIRDQQSALPETVSVTEIETPSDSEDFLSVDDQPVVQGSNLLDASENDSQTPKETAKQADLRSSDLSHSELASPHTVEIGSKRVTLTLVFLSILLSMISNFGSPRGRRETAEQTLEQVTYSRLAFVDPILFRDSKDAWLSIRRGEIWRPLTAIFIHTDPLHLAFNVVWLLFLGSALERIEGSKVLLLILLLSHIAGSLLQVMLPMNSILPISLQGNPLALGASGSVFGAFGYLWLRPQFVSEYPIYLVPLNYILMISWLTFCLTPIAGSMANGAQLGGLFTGMALAWLLPNTLSSRSTK
ncbi:MAG: rhomboid family intramembrane serine protease [Planctomycetota bacterium]|nr:rhomboid family intramembrane serine protease [Planctomycetota bacterium]